MGNSWGHQIASASEHERKLWGPCTRKCCNAVVFRTSYRYVTGRKGRVSVAERYVCEDHGRKFATKHSLVVPDPSVPGEGSRHRAAREAFVAAMTAPFTDPQ